VDERQVEFDIVKRERRLVCRMLRDMTGPMTTEEIEAQFCPLPWGDDRPDIDPFEVLFRENRTLWEMLRDVDLEAEQKLLGELRRQAVKSSEKETELRWRLDCGRSCLDG